MTELNFENFHLSNVNATKVSQGDRVLDRGQKCLGTGNRLFDNTRGVIKKALVYVDHIVLALVADRFTDSA